VGSIGRGEAWTPVICRPRLAGVDPVDRCRLRKAVKEEARGAAMVMERVSPRVVESVDGVEDVVVDVVLRWVHRTEDACVEGGCGLDQASSCMALE